ncbi:hypothetical protein ABT301_29075 [Streptomyces sp. NPDC000987]|uniref:hypothetical protein n=1 Tax=Streptomyces sp. NPDC000987 TaxID=3154374 RepID=UPI00331F9FFC
MRDYLNKTELLAALDNGERLEAHPRTAYAGEAVEYLPRVDVVGGKPTSHPDCYPWHVVGRPDYARLRNSEVVVIEPAAI